jgi:aldose sugar dehydrogenase
VAPAGADTTPVTVFDPNLEVTTFVSGLNQPIGIVFIGSNDALVLEKATGLVKRIINGVVQPTPALDLAVNGAHDRGLLSLALHPNFPATPLRVHLLDREQYGRRLIGAVRSAPDG